MNLDDINRAMDRIHDAQNLQRALMSEAEKKVDQLEFNLAEIIGKYAMIIRLVCYAFNRRKYETLNEAERELVNCLIAKDYMRLDQGIIVEG